MDTLRFSFNQRKFRMLLTNVNFYYRKYSLQGGARKFIIMLLLKLISD